MRPLVLAVFLSACSSTVAGGDPAPVDEEPECYLVGECAPGRQRIACPPDLWPPVSECVEHAPGDFCCGPTGAA